MNKINPVCLNIALSIIVDVLGWEEFTGVLWVLIFGFIFFMMLGDRPGAMGGLLNFLEKIIPSTDSIPSIVIAWFIRNQAFDKWIGSN